MLYFDTKLGILLKLLSKVYFFVITLFFKIIRYLFRYLFTCVYGLL